jgi:hypothetical protein
MYTCKHVFIIWKRAISLLTIYYDFVGLIFFQHINELEYIVNSEIALIWSEIIHVIAIFFLYYSQIIINIHVNDALILHWTPILKQPVSLSILHTHYSFDTT